MQSLVDTKKEYTDILYDALSTPICERIYEIYLSCGKTSNSLKLFQKELEKIPKWNNHIIELETANIIKKADCSYIHKLLKLTIMTSLKIKFLEHDASIKNIKIKIPSMEDFIHKCFINAANFSWKHSYLYYQANLTTVQIQNNMNIIETNIRKMISKALRQCINIKEVIEELDNIISKSMKKKSRNKDIHTKEEDTIDDNEIQNEIVESQYDESNISPKPIIDQKIEMKVTEESNDEQSDETDQNDEDAEQDDEDSEQDNQDAEQDDEDAQQDNEDAQQDDEDFVKDSDESSELDNGFKSDNDSSDDSDANIKVVKIETTDNVRKRPVFF